MHHKNMEFSSEFSVFSVKEKALQLNEIADHDISPMQKKTDISFYL